MTVPVLPDPGVSPPAGGRSGDQKAKRGRWKTVVSWFLIVLACILAVVSVVVVFTRNELLNTDTYVSTVAPLAGNLAIQAQVAKQVSTHLLDGTDVKDDIEGLLPPKASRLAAPLASGLATVTYQVTLRAVQSSAFQKIWTSANRLAHQQLVKVLTGAQPGALSTANGRVTLDLSPVAAQAKQKLDAKGITFFDHVPAARALNFVLFQSKDLAKIQHLVKLLNKVAFILPIVAFLAFIGGILMARNRRRGLVRSSFGLALSMALVLVVMAIGRNHYLGSLSHNQSVAANAAAVDIVTSVLRDSLWIILIVSAVIALGAVIVGNPRTQARFSRGHRAP
jgi:hypothetical protein